MVTPTNFAQLRHRGGALLPRGFMLTTHSTVSGAVWSLSSTFNQGNETIRASTLENFNVAIRPSNLDALHLYAASKPEMKPHIITRDIAGAAAHLLHKPMTFNENRDLC